MREDLSPFASFVLTTFGLTAGVLGALLWFCGCSLALFFALVVGFPLGNATEKTWWALGLWLIGSMLLPAIGSGMVFFAQTLTENKPHEVPTDLLPQWWLARFMRGICLLWSCLLPITTTISFVNLRIAALFFLIATVAAIRGFRYFRDKAIHLTPPYPPGGRPRPWKTRS